MLIDLPVFKKRPFLFYLVQTLLLALAVAFSLLMPRQYIYWNTSGVIGYTVGLFITFGLTGALLANVGEHNFRFLFVECFLFAIVGAGLPYFINFFLNRLLYVDLYVAMNIGCIAQFIVLGVGNLLLVLRTANTFAFKQAVRESLAGGLICIILVSCVLPFSGDFFRFYLRSYSFLSEPCVFVSSDDTYAILFATSAPGTGVVTVTLDGVETEYAELVDGMVAYGSQLHRVDVPKTSLDNGSYRLSSRKTGDCTGTEYRMGKTIVTKEYRLRPYSGNGDVSFMCISDNQGAAAPTQKAVKKAAEKYDYDFVMLLGDHSEAFNEIEEDFIKSLLTVAGLASRGERLIYYTVGNHEYRGMKSNDLFKLMPTPSGEFYYSFTMGDAYFTVLNFGDEDDDDDPRFGGVAQRNDYKDAEYEWLKETFATKEYENYRYNVVLSHIPLIDENDELSDEYKFEEFIELLTENNVGYAVSGHTHLAPVEKELDELPFKNLHVGSYYRNKAAFRNSIVRLKDGEYSFEVYDSRK